MASATRSLLSVFAILFLMGSTAAIGMGIYAVNTDDDKSTEIPLKFLLPASIANTLLTIILLYLTATITTIGPGAKLFISILLIAGLVLEIYLTNYVTNMPESVATYFVIVLNILVRSFYVLQFVQDEWTRPFGTSVPTVAEVAKVVTPAPIAALPTVIAKPPAPPQQNKGRMIDKWDSIWARIRDSPKGLDENSKNQAYREIIRPAKGNLTIDIVEQAAKALKYKDGTPVSASDIKLGGRS
jgi:hypothetical protein